MSKEKSRGRSVSWKFANELHKVDAGIEEGKEIEWKGRTKRKVEGRASALEFAL